MLNLVFSGGVVPASGGCRIVGDWIDDRGRVWARAFSQRNLSWIELAGLGTFAFSTGSTEVRVWPHPEASHKAVVDTFSRVVQPIILQALGQQVLHAAAAIGPAGVVAFSGSRGCGKSTLAFAMQQVGWQQFADDALLLRFDRLCVTACPLPFTPRLRPDSRAHFADQPGLILSAEPQLTGLPLAAVFLLQQNDGLNSPRVLLMQGARALSQLLAHAHFFDTKDPRHMRQLYENYLQLVTQVPVFTLEYRPNFRGLTQLTHAVIAATSNDAGAIDSSELRPSVPVP
jgi:hypothetical protein